MRSLILVFTMLCLPPFASAAVFEDAIGVSFPDRVGGLQLQGRETFAQKALGSATRYRSDGHLLASTYVYTGGLSSIPEGTESAVVRKHFAQVIDEAKQMEAMGHASKVTVPATPGQVTQFAGCGPQFIWKAFEMDLDGNLIVSNTYLTAVRNNFVKLRISYPKTDITGRQSADRFIEDIRKVLGRC
ncbi:hypothetical protein [Variovorax sp.]|jgi:hypothetical protein|uniref:hypothetical protein n=1 Tax=Variovorax sp. TaxID=1871043 RepID=UPI0037DA3E25